MATNIRKNVTKIQTRENQESGITLVALVISIIVLLILATVSINLVINNGILDKAKTAVDKYSDEQIKEEIALLTQEMKMHQVLNGGSEEESLRSTFQSHDSNATVTKSDSLYEVTYKGQKFLLGSDLEYIPIVEADPDEWTFNQSTQTLTAYNGDLSVKRGNQEIGEVIIPNYYNGKKIKKINGIFKNNLSLTKIKISYGIEEIGGQLCRGCTNLRGDVIIPDSVTETGTEIFMDCSSLDGILKLSRNLEEIKSFSFLGCSNLKGNIEIPDSVILIGTQAFQDCSSFDGKIILGKNIQTISGNAFNGCSKLVGDLIIPDSVTSIGSNAFASCSSLDGRIKLSENLTTIERILWHCNNLTGELVIPEKVTNYKGDGSEYFSSIKFLNRETVIVDHISTIRPSIGKIIGYSGSTAQAYATKYTRRFETIPEN